MQLQAFNELMSAVKSDDERPVNDEDIEWLEKNRVSLSAETYVLDSEEKE